MTSQKNTLAAVRRIGKRLGVEVSVTEAGRWVTINADAPDGMIWDANGCTVLVATWMAGDAKFRDEAIADILERMGMGYSEGYGEDESCDE